MCSDVRAIGVMQILLHNKGDLKLNSLMTMCYMSLFSGLGVSFAADSSAEEGWHKVEQRDDRDSCHV